MTVDYALNLMRNYRQCDSEDIANGIGWYDLTREYAYQWGNGDVWKAAGVIAAYSPCTPWERNLELAQSSLELGFARTDTIGTNALKAQLILDGAPVLSTLNGPKTTAFASAIADPNSRLVTVDSHIYSVAHNEHYYTKQAQFGIRVYRAIADAVIECADYTGHSPSQFQAIIWVNWRKRHPRRNQKMEANE